MRRPGPLRDWPLDQILPTTRNGATNVSPFSQPRSNKRALSPSRLSVFSPAKRRILNVEGIYFTTKALETPKKASSPRHHDFFGGQSTGREDTVQPLAGSSASNVQSNCTTPPKNRRLSTRLSPRSKTTRAAPSSAIILSSDASPTSARRSSRMQTSQDNIAPTVITRELPPPPDRQSRHYPGFDTYQDTEITIAVPPISQLHSNNSVIESDLDVEIADREAYKENIVPRRKAKKGSPSSLLKAAVLAPEAKEGFSKVGKALSMSETLTDSFATAETPSHTVGFGQPPHTPRIVTSPVRRERKQQMQAEIDGRGSSFGDTIDLRA
ncbi:hypothetical protein BJ138DRAFT_598363 [Hygrophoropsis aurantiaca]|uniref:Uncharacterized protein n=1 Tax=Hygrophoropsis aurantiaca TaxID=72124 RepID=A0ACB8ATK6_9AGAM|nr:hypothetical protein BJ138DRAFT_598363 [Hygrophoropsis aurantiaca]